MPLNISIDDSKCTLKIHDAGSLTASDPVVMDLWKNLSAFATSVVGGLDKITINQVSGILYTYEIKTKDGRTWNQNLKFDEGVQMTFDAPEFWKLSEFEPHRIVRSVIIDLIQQFGTSKITANWP